MQAPDSHVIQPAGGNDLTSYAVSSSHLNIHYKIHCTRCCVRYKLISTHSTYRPIYTRLYKEACWSQNHGSCLRNNIIKSVFFYTTYSTWKKTPLAAKLLSTPPLLFVTVQGRHPQAHTQTVRRMFTGPIPFPEPTECLRNVYGVLFQESPAES